VPAAVAQKPATQAVQAAAGEGLLSVNFTANCWTRVTDADGKVLVSALRKPGETINLAVRLPLELRLGYASGAQVAFNGAAVDMAPFTTGETARIKLGQ
jgi:cytoskeleton protein RodZ